MKKIIIILILIGMFSFAVYEFIGTSSAANQRVEEVGDQKDLEIGINVGKLAPDFYLNSLDGERIKLSELRGKHVLLNFWATWCPPCRAEMPDLQQFYEDKDIEILAVNLTDSETSKAKVEDFVSDYGLSFPVLMDVDAAVSELYAIQPIPTSFFIDKDGVIRKKAFGAMNYESMVQELDKMN